MREKYLHVTYCDDVRHEVSGKTTLVGCYGSEMLINGNFPYSLHKLCTHIVLSLPAEYAPSDISFEGYVGDKEVFKVEIPDEMIKKFAAKVAEPTDLPNAVRQTIIYGEISPLQLEGPTIVKIVAKVDGYELMGPRLTIKQLNKPETITSN